MQVSNAKKNHEQNVENGVKDNAEENLKSVIFVV